MDPEKLQRIILDAGISADIKDLKSPTEDFMIHLIIEYIKMLGIDASIFGKLMDDELEYISYPEASVDAIKVVNLHTALTALCNEIFIKEFCLTDITNPGPKRARAQINMLFNFYIYFRNKQVENKKAFMKLDEQLKAIINMMDEKDTIIADTAASVVNYEHKIELKEKLLLDIEELQKEIDNDNNKSKQVEELEKEIILQYQNSLEQCRNYKAEAIKLRAITTNLESKVVKSPEEYSKDSQELDKALETKKEERQVLNHSNTNKKMQIKCNETAQELVQRLHESFTEFTNNILQNSKEQSEKVDVIEKQIQEINSDVAQLKRELSYPIDEQCDFSSIDVDSNQLLSQLDDQFAHQFGEHNARNVSLQELQSEVLKKKLDLDSHQKTISAIEKQTFEFLTQFQEYVNKNIAEELHIQEKTINIVRRNKN